MILSVLANIDVDSLLRATDFYCRALGLRVGRRFGSSAVELLGFWADPRRFICQRNLRVRLRQRSRLCSATPRLHQALDTRTPVHLDFVVPEIQSAVVQARNAGARLEGEVRTHNWGRIAVMADPFGHGFCLIEFLGRG